MVKTAASKQMAVLSYIHQQVATHGYPPTVREICKAVGLSSTSTVHGHINRLIKKGYLQKDPSKPRAEALHTRLGFRVEGTNQWVGHPMRHLVKLTSNR